MITATESNLAIDVLRSEQPVLLVLWAPWCKPCAEVDRALEELAPALEGRVLLAKANVDQCRSLLARLGVLFLPTFILFIGGHEAGRLSGVPTLTELHQLAALADGGCTAQ